MVAALLGALLGVGHGGRIYHEPARRASRGGLSGGRWRLGDRSRPRWLRTRPQLSRRLPGGVAAADPVINRLQSRSVMASARTLFEKIWNRHVVVQEPDCPAILYVDLHLVHEVTSPQAFEGLRRR